MKLDVTKTERTFTLTLTEHEAGVLRGLVGGLRNADSADVQTKLFELLADSDLEPELRSIGSYEDEDGGYLAPCYNEQGDEETDD
jgi:hypothetical protein